MQTLFRHIPVGTEKIPVTCVGIVGVLVGIRGGQLKSKALQLDPTECMSVACTNTSISHSCPSTLYHHTFFILPLYTRFALRLSAIFSAFSISPASRKPSNVTNQSFSDWQHKTEPTYLAGRKRTVKHRTDMPDSPTNRTCFVFGRCVNLRRYKTRPHLD
jgi:hypothetical protein